MDSKTSQTSLSPDLENVLQKAAAPTQQGWVGVSTLLSRSDEKNLDPVISELLDQVDDSHYSLTDWLSALLAFDEWLSEKNMSARPLSTMIGYVHCSTMSNAETLVSPELKRLVLGNLNEWGFDALQPISTGEK